MSITATCPKCAKMLRVRDELVGKKLRCPGCGTSFEARATPAPAGRPVTRKVDQTGPKVAIAWGPIIVGALVLAVVVGIIAFIRGPVRVNREWEAIGGKAQDDVIDVVTHALRAYASREGMYDPNKTSGPSAQEVLFIMDRFVMSMPEAVPFKGGSDQGQFTGKYHPANGEVEAQVDIGGGLTLSGQVKKGDITLNVTGRVKDGKPTVEIDGKKAEIYYPPKVEE
jgi:hypothetical protein